MISQAVEAISCSGKKERDKSDLQEIEQMSEEIMIIETDKKENQEVGHRGGKRYNRMVQNPKRDKIPLKEINGNKRKSQIRDEIIEEEEEQDRQLKN